MRLAAAWVLGACATMVACNEPPSLRARWSVVDRQGVEQDTTSPLVCTSLGINTVRMRIFDELGFFVDDSFYACFANGFEDPEDTVAGPALPEGRYAVEIRGVQRNNVPWPVELVDADLDGKPDDPLTECAVEDPACDPRDIACDCAELEARDDHTERLVDFVLVAPDECVDGIDNDRDGVLDSQDPSCVPGVVPGVEGNPVSKVQFRVALTLFGDSDGLTCSALGLSDVRARVCPRQADDPDAACADEDSTDTLLACRTGDPTFFELVLAQGDYVLEMAGLAPDGTPRTAVERFDVLVSAGAGSFVPVDFDLGPADFDPPINAAAGLVVEFARDAAATDGRPCATAGEVTIADVLLEVRDAHGGPLSTPVLASDGTPLDGSTPLACPSAVLRTESLVWGGWSLRVVGRNAEGTACFSTDGAGPNGADAPLVLAPSNIGLIVPRVVDADGAVPAGCE